MAKIHDKLNDLKKIIDSFSPKKEKRSCFLDGCNGVAINSHTLSESRVLELLEGKGEKNKIGIYHLDNEPSIDYKSQYVSTYHETKRSLKFKGKSETSIFFGFCNPCDTSIFKKLDNHPFENNDEVKFLHSYRAYALHVSFYQRLAELFMNKISPQIKDSVSAANDSISDLEKSINLISNSIPDEIKLDYNSVAPILNSEFEKLVNNSPINNRTETKIQMEQICLDLLNPDNYPITGEKFKNSLINIFNFSKSANSQLSSILPQIEILTDTLKDKGNLKSNINSLYKNSRFSNLLYLNLSLGKIYEIACNFVFQYDEHLITLTIFPEKETEKTHVILSSLDNNEMVKRLFSRINIMSDNEVKLFLSRTIISKGSNVFFSPKYYNNMDEEMKRLITNKKGKYIIIPTKMNLFT